MSNNNIMILPFRYWNRLEIFCRELTSRYDYVTIISGPLFLPVKQKDGRKIVTYQVSSPARVQVILLSALSLYQVIGENNIGVPTHLYKVILAERAGEVPSLGECCTATMQS